MRIDGKVHCFFEKSGTFKNEQFEPFYSGEIKEVEQ